ncbi:sulfotransferase domain-containing protein [Candidatus Pacearchaeota archaeon]|nr:sulfotransferase domain-containing protein [Candidatus Pacearchaeota archaeon]
MRIDFIGVGFPRSGSTWLTYCLSEHPEISIPKFNLLTEINYFPEEYEVMGLKNYIVKFLNCDFEKKVGELSTLIILEKRSAKLLKKLFPNIKIIIYKRNEDERAESDFIVKKNFDLYDVKLQDLKLNQEYLIKPWIKEFGKSNLFIFDLDSKNQKKELQNLYKFLEVNPDFIPPSFDREKGPYAKSFKHNTAWKDKKNKIPKTSKLGKFRKVINKIKDFSRKNKKIYYFMKRNMCLDFYYQWLSRRL